MKHWLAAILLIALWGVVLAIMLTPEVDNGHGFPHSKFDAMDQGGTGLARHDSVFAAAWIFGSLIIGVFVGLLGFGTVGHPSPRWPTMVLGGLIYEGVFAMMCWSYYKSLDQPDSAEFWGPFPAGTSWLLFGIWLIPLFFIVLYVASFNHWVMPPENLQEFKQLVAKMRKSKPVTKD